MCVLHRSLCISVDLKCPLRPIYASRVFYAPRRIHTCHRSPCVPLLDVFGSLLDLFLLALDTIALVYVDICVSMLDLFVHCRTHSCTLNLVHAILEPFVTIAIESCMLSGTSICLCFIFKSLSFSLVPLSIIDHICHTFCIFLSLTINIIMMLEDPYAPLLDPYVPSKDPYAPYIPTCTFHLVLVGFVHESPPSIPSSFASIHGITSTEINLTFAHEISMFFFNLR